MQNNALLSGKEEKVHIDHKTPLSFSKRGNREWWVTKRSRGNGDLKK